MAKLPGFYFYSGDWLKDPELRRCTKAEKGMWIDMLAVLSECSDRGVFSTGGVPWSDQEIAVAIGGDIAENLLLLAALLRKRVARRNKFGCVFSARMVRDEQTRLHTNARVQNHRVRKKCNADVTHNVTPLLEEEKEREKELEVLKKPNTTSKAKPTFEELASYCKERGELISADAFWDFYESVGWKIGNRPMKDWQAAVRTWEKRVSGNSHDHHKTATERRNDQQTELIGQCFREAEAAKHGPANVRQTVERR